MKFLQKMEKKVGKFAIPNLMRVLIVCYIIGYVFQFAFPEMLSLLALEPSLVFKGQIWRLITWILIPTGASNILFMLIMLFFYYSIGSNLEKVWGAFKFNLYIFGGIFFTDVAAILLYFILGNQTNFLISMAGLFSAYYINLSLFLAFALTYPEHEILLMFVIPVKMKWMGLVYGVLQVYSIFTENWVGKTAIIASLLNFIIFFMMTRSYKHISPKEIKRKAEFKKQVREVSMPIRTRHKCTVCGRTDLEFPDLEFRYCSKCDGNYEYCQDHLFTHEHIKKN